MKFRRASAEKTFFIIVVAIILIVAVYFLLDKFNITGRVVSNPENVSLNNESARQNDQLNIDSVAPTIISTSPSSDESSVSIARLISVTFDEEINSSTLNSQTFKLLINGNVVSGNVEYKNKIATFAPAATLLNGRAYSVTLTTGIKDLVGNALASDYSWNFTTVPAGAGVGGGGGGGSGGSSSGTTPDTTVPTIGATTIPSNSANVAINKGISVTFSEPMDASTINSQTFIVTKEVISSSASISDSLLDVHISSRALIAVNGTVSYTSQVATFTPESNFDYNSTYFVTLTTGIKDAAGNSLASNYTLNFTTLKPALEPQDPKFESLRDGILTYSWIASPKGCLALQSVPFVPAKESDWKNVLNEVSYENGINKVKINTSAVGIQFFRLIQVSAPCDISSPRVVSTNPTNNAENVPVSAPIGVTFSELMNTSTFNNQNFILTNGTSSVTGTFSSNGNTMVFAPSENINYNSVYFVTLTTGIKDAAGNSLASNYTWSFKTTALSLEPQDPKFESLRDGILTYSWIAAPKGCLALQSVPFVPAKESDWKNVLNEVSYENGINKVKINTSAVGIQFFRLIQVSAPCDISSPRVVSTNPANNAENVPVDVVLSAVFDEDMDVSSVMNHFALKKEGVIIAGTVNYSNKVVTFKPLANLSFNTSYTAVITSDARDFLGNSLIGNYTWSFKTRAE